MRQWWQCRVASGSGQNHIAIARLRSGDTSLGAHDARSHVETTRWFTRRELSPSSQDYFYLPGNYVSLHENLLDLTHLSYVHAQSFGTPDYARAPYTVEADEGRYRITRRVVPTRLPPVWAKPTGLEHDHAARIATSEFVSPSLHVVSVRFFDANLQESDRLAQLACIAHYSSSVTRPQARSTHGCAPHCGRCSLIGFNISASNTAAPLPRR